MPREPVIATLSHLAAPTNGVFRGRSATDLGVGRNRLRTLTEQGVLERVHPDTYRLIAVPRSPAQQLRAALLWAGAEAAAAGRSAAQLYRLEGVRAGRPEIVLPYSVRGRSPRITVPRHRSGAPSLG